MMEKHEFYLEKYRKQIVELNERDELWRLCLPNEEAFLEKLNKIYIAYERHNYINDCHRENSIKLMIEILLQEKITKEEFTAQAQRLKKAAEKGFQEDAPRIIEFVNTLIAPVEDEQLRVIERWIARKQITVYDLPYAVFKQHHKFRQSP